LRIEIAASPASHNLVLRAKLRLVKKKYIFLEEEKNKASEVAQGARRFIFNAPRSPSYLFVCS